MFQLRSCYQQRQQRQQRQPRNSRAALRLVVRSRFSSRTTFFLVANLVVDIMVLLCKSAWRPMHGGPAEGLNPRGRGPVWENRPVRIRHDKWVEAATHQQFRSPVPPP